MNNKKSSNQKSSNQKSSKWMTYGALALGALIIGGIAQADEHKTTTEGETEVSRSTSHNPLTQKTTTTVVRKAKKGVVRHDGKTKGAVMGEDTQTIERQVSDDGKKTSVRTETVHTEETK